MKKTLITASLLAVLLVVSMFPLKTSAAKLEVNPIGCSDAYEVCVGVYLEDGDKYASSNRLYIPAGEQVHYSVYNGSSQFQIGCRVYKDGEVVAIKSAAANGGGGGGSFISTGGYYWIQLESGDYTSPYTTSGYGQVYYYID